MMTVKSSLIAKQSQKQDLLPFDSIDSPLRGAIALLTCALMAVIAMVEIPESAISCYFNYLFD